MTGPYDHEDDLSTLEEALGYTFDDVTLLRRAVTHRSYANEVESVVSNNQRLEFLGDSVLGLVVAESLFEKLPRAAEGSLSSFLASLVNENALRLVADELRLGHYMRLGKGEVMSGGRQKSSVLADAYEAVLAAIYLDGGMQAARDVVGRLHADAIETCEPSEIPEDHKSRLQRFVQSEGLFRPEYAIVEERGPAHARVFIATVAVDGDVLGQGEGRSKKVAEQQAASAALERWEDRD